MKRAKMFLTAFAVVATVGSALAVTNYFGQGSVYCGNTCAANTRVNFRNNPNGTQINPCGTSGGVEVASYIYDETFTCKLNNTGQKYDAVTAGN